MASGLVGTVDGSKTARTSVRAIYLVLFSLVGIFFFLAAAEAAHARSIDAVTLTPRLELGPVSASDAGTPGSIVPANFSLANSGSDLEIQGESEFVAPLLNTSVVRGWWVVVEARTAGGSWQPVAGHASADSGYSFNSAPPLSSGISATATPITSLGVAYPTGGDRVVGTQALGLAQARWQLDLESNLGVFETASLVAAANVGDVRLRWRIEFRNTGLFGIISSGARSHTAPFTQMLASQSSIATNANVAATGDGRTQSFDSSTTPELAAIPGGVSVSLDTTAQLPSIAPRGASESSAAYVDRLNDALDDETSITAQASFTTKGPAIAYWWWPWDTDSLFDQHPDRSVGVAPSTVDVGRQIPIVSLAKSGPESVPAGQSAPYSITAANNGNIPAEVSVSDEVDGFSAVPVAGYGEIAAGESMTGEHVHHVSAATPSGALSDIAHVTWTDTAGNSYGPADASFTTMVEGDETAPLPPVFVRAPASVTNEMTAEFEFEGEPGGEFWCRVDSGPEQSCASPHSIDNLSNGQHQFYVRQIDAAGNQGSAATYVWTIDTEAPAAPEITSAPNGEVSSRAASISFAGEAGAGFECRMNDTDWAPCASPINYVDLADGINQFSVRQTDIAGNVSESAMASWTVDVTPPDPPTITGAPAPVSGGSEAVFEFMGEAGATFECVLDGPAFEACASPKEFIDLDEGAHLFSVRSKDSAGNVSSAVNYVWSIEFENNQCKPLVEESTILELPDEAGMEGGGE